MWGWGRDRLLAQGVGSAALLVKEESRQRCQDPSSGPRDHRPVGWSQVTGMPCGAAGTGVPVPGSVGPARAPRTALPSNTSFL